MSKHLIDGPGLCRKYVLVCTSYDNQLCIKYNVDIVVNYVIKIIKKIFLAIVFFRNRSLALGHL